ncbi:PAS domain-containing protein [Patescibacteria group bacterium]|nr:MAG: PAS domain-containing protein [Patescibacteria group bacterium]
MNQHEHHAELVSGFFKEQRQIFDSSSQAMYAFLDDDCRVCNQKFATLLGYSSPDEWFKVNVQGAFPAAFVDDGSQQTLVAAYQNAMEKMEGATIKVVWKKKSGGIINTTVILVPVAYRGHLFALHFIS